MRCVKCGMDFDKNSILCPYCGARYDSDDSGLERVVTEDGLALAPDPDQTTVRLADPLEESSPYEKNDRFGALEKADLDPIDFDHSDYEAHGQASDEQSEPILDGISPDEGLLDELLDDLDVELNTPTENRGTIPMEDDKPTMNENDQPTMSDRLKARTGGVSDTHEQPPVTLEWTEGGYSGKALRATAILGLLITAPFIAAGIWLSIQGYLQGGLWTTVAWCALLAIPALFWIRYVCIYIYRVWTIKYRLNEFRFFHQEGIFRSVQDVLEVIDIEDLQLEQTLIDRYINGGVGTVIVKSQDSTDPTLYMHGMEDPQKVFNSIDEARRKQRMERGLKSI